MSNFTAVSPVSALSTAELAGKLYELRSKERGLLVEFLGHLGELDRRKLYLELGYPSSFELCVRFLGLSRSSSFRRLTAARLLQRFPVVGHHLLDGRLGLTTLVELREVLCAERLDEILGRAAGRCEEEVKALVAALAPRPPVPDLLRRLPDRPSSEPPALDLFGAAPAPATDESIFSAGPPRGVHGIGDGGLARHAAGAAGLPEEGASHSAST